MWIFLNDAFLSIVKPPNDSRNLLVRARVEGDIQRVFPRAKVTETPNRDYRFRAFIQTEVVAGAISAQVRMIDYGNFKNSVREDDRHDAYAGVWGIMYRLQGKRLAPEPRRGRIVGHRPLGFGAGSLDNLWP